MDKKDIGKKLLIDAIRGAGFKSIEQAEFFTMRKAAIWTGDQHNPAWQWRKEYLESLDLEQLEALYEAVCECLENEFKSIELDEGKYRFYEESSGILKCLRHGHEWRDFIGDKAILYLYYRCVELEEENLKLRKSYVDRGSELQMRKSK